MVVLPLNSAGLLVPDLVQIIHDGMSAKECRKHGIGRLRRDLTDRHLPHFDAEEHLLADICRSCPMHCELARKRM